jgi:hypothetical protein
MQATQPGWEREMNGMRERGHLNEPPNKKHLQILALNAGSVTGCAYSYPDTYTLFIAHLAVQGCAIFRFETILDTRGTGLHRAGAEPELVFFPVHHTV